MNKYLVRNFKWRENLGKVPAKVYRLDKLLLTFTCPCAGMVLKVKKISSLFNFFRGE